MRSKSEARGGPGEPNPNPGGVPPAWKEKSARENFSKSTVVQKVCLPSGRLGSDLKGYWSRLEASGAIVRPSGALLGPPEASRGLLERSWSHLEASWSGLGDVWSPLGTLLEPS